MVSDWLIVIRQQNKIKDSKTEVFEKVIIQEKNGLWCSLVLRKNVLQKKTNKNKPAVSLMPCQFLIFQEERLPRGERELENNVHTTRDPKCF